MILRAYVILLATLLLVKSGTSDLKDPRLQRISKEELISLINQTPFEVTVT